MAQTREEQAMGDEKAMGDEQAMSEVKSDTGWIDHQGLPGAVQRIVWFGNGFGASVVKGPHPLIRGGHELAVLHTGGSLCYETEVTDDVVGWVDDEREAELLAQIASLEPKYRCDHVGVWR